MYRRAIEELKSWKESSDRKPLIIRWARQTGKVEFPQAKRLRSYYNRYVPKKAFRTSLSGYREEDCLINLPLYSVHSIGKLARHLP